MFYLFHFTKIKGAVLKFKAITPSGTIIDSFTVVNPLVGIKPERQRAVLQKYILNNAYPNPFNPSTTINYYIPHSGYVSLKVYDCLGKEVATLVNEYKTAGDYSVKFYARNGASVLPDGIYFYRLLSDSFNETRKMILLK